MDTENETKVVETKKCGKGTLVALIISIIIIIALAGYICYDKVLLNNSETEKTSKSTANKKTIVETDKEDDKAKLFLHQTIELARQIGFFSIWTTVFYNDPIVLCSLISAFPGTERTFFDEYGHPKLIIAKS